MEKKLRKAIDFYIDKTNINEILLQCNFYGVNNIDKLKEKMYEYYSDGAILEGLCKILIRNHCVGSKYIEYYELGIKAEFKITRLFELYIESRRPDDMSPLPKIVLMYFSYNNSLEATYKAYLYANIINNKTDKKNLTK